MRYLFSNQDLKKLIIPLIIEQFLSVMVGIVDVAMVAQAGETAVSGVSLVNSLNVLLVLIFNSIATGGAVVTARYLGAKEETKACESTDQLMMAVLLAGAAVTTVSVVFNRGILHLIYGSVSAEVMDCASIYFYLTAVSYPFLALYSGAAAVCRSMGDSKTSMHVSTVMNVVNVAGNGIMVYFYHMGAAGVGIATLASRILAAVMMMRLLIDQNRKLHVTVDSLPKINGSMIREILRIGIPTGIENGMFQVGKLVLASLISTFGTASIAANGVVSTLSLFQVIPGSALGLAMITVIGQTIGAGEFEQARHYQKKLIRLAILLHLILNSVFLFLADEVVGLYHLSEEAYRMTYDIIVFHGICCILIWPFSFTLPNAIRAAGDVKFTMRTSIMTMILVRIGMGIVLSVGLDLGLRGIWYAMVLDWSVRGICFRRRITSGKWLQKAKGCC